MYLADTYAYTLSRLKPDHQLHAELLMSHMLQPGDCVILNAANSTVGQLVVQLCRLLQLRCVAVARCHDDDGFDKVAAWLKGLGASEVIADHLPVKVGCLQPYPDGDPGTSFL